MSASAAVNALTVCKPWTREDIAARAARDIPEGFYVNIGIGIPVLVANYVPPSAKSSSIRRTAFSAWVRSRSRRQSIAG